MKKCAKIICFLLILTLSVSFFAACDEKEKPEELDCLSGIWFTKHTKISSFVTNIPENPIIIRNYEELQIYLDSYVRSHPENKARTYWIINYLNSFGNKFFDTKAFVLVRDSLHSESETDYDVCSLTIEAETLVINFRYSYEGAEKSANQISNSYILSVMKSEIEGIERTGIREYNTANAVNIILSD